MISQLLSAYKKRNPYPSNTFPSLQADSVFSFFLFCASIKDINFLERFILNWYRKTNNISKEQQRQYQCAWTLGNCPSSCIFSPFGSVCLVQLLEEDVLVKLLPVPRHQRELQGHSEPPASWSATKNTILVCRLLGQCYLPGIWYQMALPVPARSHLVPGSHQPVLGQVKFSLCLINGLLVLKD